ncbi:MAG: hypothetical protein JXB62_15980 [Pirellulales bacterium]|nr:hypothetical protein [Pirellulales bacterium]
MHRTDRSFEPLKPIPARSSLHVESGLFSSPSHDTACALFVPMHYESGYAYPLVVWLHEEGDDERQLMRMMPLVSMRNYVAVAPRGVRLALAGGSGRDVYGWRQTEEIVRQAEQRIFDSIEQAQRKVHVAARRIFLAGFGHGGTMAFRVALNHPSRFAGVLSFGGAFPHGRNPLGNLIEVRRLPIFLAVGRDSRRYLPETVCEDLRLFHAAGLSTTLRQYPCGQELSPQMLADMDRWIIEQITAPGAAVERPSRYWSPDPD